MKRVHHFALVILFISLAIYLALATWMTQNWKPLGDEPHYLLAAHSLVVDRDFDLANNYARQDFQNFLDGDSLDPHVKILPNDAQILNHDLGLPIFIALPYALGGRAGVEIFLAVCGALLAWQMWKLAFDVTHNALRSTLAWFVLAFTPPLVLYATLIYPEVIGALIFIWATRTILFHSSKEISRARLIILALSFIALPWLSVRFLVLLTLLVVFCAVQWSDPRRRAVWLFGIAAIAIATYFFVNNVLLAGVVPRGNPTELASGNLSSLSLESLARGVVGWWIDPQRGTLILAPVYLVALAGIPRLVRENFRVGILLLSPLIVLIPLVALLGGFWIPFEVGARYFVVALPLLAAPLAFALRAGFEYPARWQRAAFVTFASLLALLSFWNGALMLTDASYAYGSVVTAYSRAVGSDVSPFFAGMGHAAQISPHNVTANNPNVSVEELNGEAVWRAPRGDAGLVVSSSDLTELTVGNYAIEFRAAAKDATTDADVLTLDVFSVEGLSLAHSSWRASDLTSDSLQPIAVFFDNPYFDRWGFPLTLQVMTTGEAEIFLGTITFDPNTPTTWLRAGIWIALVLGIIVVLNLDWLHSKSFRPTADGLRRA